MTILSNCCWKKELSNNNFGAKYIHRAMPIEKPICNNETYADLVYCIILYNELYEQANKDKSYLIK